MLEFDEYKVWLNNFKPQLETLKASLGLDQAARELDLLQSQSAAPGFWDDPDKAQKTQQRIKALQDKIENQAKRERSWSDLVTLARWATRRRTLPFSLSCPRAARPWRRTWSPRGWLPS